MMKNAAFTGPPARKSTICRLRHLSLVAVAFALAGCGGGGGGGDDSNPPATTTASNVVFSGPISGFGSVIINGVRFDDSAARVVGDDDSDIRTSDLRLGMMIDLQGVRDSNGITGKASSISTKSYVQGPITAIGRADSTITVVGVPVRVVQDTFFDGVSSLDALNVNDFIEVHGIPGALGVVTATRIEKKSSDSEVRLIGIAQDANAESFRLHGNLVRYNSARLDNIQGRVGTGMQVRVRGALTESTTITANRVKRIELIPAAQSGTGMEIEGAITSFTSATDFAVNGIKVNVPSIARREGTPALGARVEVEGAVDGQGVLVASKVEVKNGSNGGSDDDDTEVKSRIFSIDTQSSTFTVRDGTITVQWDVNTRFDSETLPQRERSLAVNQPLEIKGNIRGNVLLATSIKVDR